MRVLQVLPALYSGGVERGTVEFAAELVRRGHESFVVSQGGPKIRELEAQGSTHVTLPVHRKSLASFGQILPMRRLLREIEPDVVHVRSRMPAWITRLAWKGLPKDQRPALVSTFHGMYSVNPYSAVMARADHVIAISECVRDYVLANFAVEPERLTVIQRGVDVNTFREREPDADRINGFYHDFPALRGKRLIMMPGRISRWKGQTLFLEAMAEIIRHHPECHGLIVGGAEPGKEHFLRELEQHRHRLGLDDHVTFAGQRNDMADLYLIADVVCHMSTKPEPFGRTVTEALASGTPVAAFNRGGAAETLQACFPKGLVTPDDTSEFARRVMELLTETEHPIVLPERFHLKAQVDATLNVYQWVLKRD
ncbi:Glycosyltransferase involved in cell wall bisynthesis [Marinobacter daqiaonensis]|uniref:Glycosyltransferase involved in cell wall bisynthesis n=1 Tax=Marinobacter daqiaonensis TaxID=650891 RepID=A0A1I6K2F2_9GAMM|nr:glycosyltransferase family 4 protein [Marinobacter daqiaonensis]SFR85432.1 Glycosyltransferase involved in cell wall bisynthesis [Marinobacter daqiaonensis]